MAPGTRSHGSTKQKVPATQELAGKNALVTGGSRGIGAAIALALSEKGADVAVTYERSADRAAQLVRTIEGMGRKAVAIRADSADPGEIQRSVAEAVRVLGGLDILVNNAAIARYNNIADFTVEDLDALLAVNVRGPVLASKAAIPHLRQGGRIINIGSAGADRIVGVPGTVYYMTKAALQAFNRGLARELGSRDITVNLVQPGSTNTDSNPETGESADYQRSLIPLGRFNQPQDVAAAVAFLATPAARQITGTILTVDGGALS
ncbi:3-oxoacyl-ACP reductase FabG [Stenotrophomonas maltophilia]|nr:3-oxoacyl-ACP reductase FabG [Stenotrophomonas maltophilia]